MLRFLLFFALLAPLQVRAQIGDENPVRIVSAKAPETVTAGKTFDVVVEVSIAPPYHIYGTRQISEETITAFSVSGGDGRVKIAGKPKADHPPTRHKDKYMSYDFWEDKVSLSVPVEVSGDPGSVTFTLSMDHMACTMEACLAPAVLSKDVTVKVQKATEKPAETGPAN